MVCLTNEDLAGGGLDLGVALETEVGVTLGQEFLMNRTVGLMAGDAAFTHGFVFEDERPRLLAVA